MDEDNDDSDTSSGESLSSGSLHTIEPSDLENCFEYIDPCFYNALYRACEINNTKVAEEELKRGVDVNNVDNRGRTYLHVAAQNNSLNVVRLLLAQPTIRLDVEDHEGNTPLHLAREEDIIKGLVAAGCDVNARNNYMETPLLYMLSDGREDTCNLMHVLLELGTNLNILDGDLMSVFANILLKFEEEDAYELSCKFLEHDGDVNQLFDCHPLSNFMFAVVQGKLEIMKLFLPYVSNINEIHALKGYSVLLRAMYWKSDIAPELVQLGADINHCNGDDSCLSASLNYTETHLFKHIWHNCDKSYVLSHQRQFLTKFLQFNKFKKDDFLDVLYIILDSEFAVYLVQQAILLRIYDDLIEKFTQLKVQRADRVKVFYTFLTISNEIDVRDLFMIYQQYGFNEELEAFLVVGMNILNFVPFSCFITRLCYPSYNFNHQKYDMKPRSLVELSRDAIRKCIRPATGNTYFKYYNEIKRLDIPQVYKDIICLKRPITALETVTFTHEEHAIYLHW